MQGFCVIGIVIAVGYVAARMRIGGPSAQMVLNRFSFFVSSPCLMFAILSKEPIFDIFHPSIIVAFFSAVLVGVVFLVLNRMFFHLNAPDATIGALNSLYLNSNNIGLPIATYILGNPALVAPILVMQQAIFTPVGLTVLDVTTKGKVSIKEIAKQPLHQPLLIGSLLGIVVSLIALVPITSLIQNLSGIADLQAKLPLGYSLLLIAISIAITVVGGLIPARKAAKKDPVIALRTE